MEGSPLLASRYRFLIPAAGLATAMSVLILAADLNFTNLGGYDPSYDSGVYLESARLLRHGFPAYVAVFSSQPPLWLPLLKLALLLFGESFYAGQLLMAIAAMITVAAVMIMVEQLQGHLSALLAAVLVVLAPVELTCSRSVAAEGPSIAFAVAGMAAAARYSSVGRRVWMVASAIMITCSILTKLFGLYTVPAVLLFVIARWWRELTLDRRTKLQGVINDTLIIGAIMMGACAVLVPVSRMPEVWNQAVRFHWIAAGESQATVPDNWKMLFQAWPAPSLQWLILILSALCLSGGCNGLVVFTWLLCTLIGLLTQRPLFMHHLLALTPPVAVAAAFGWGQVWRWSLNCWRSATPSLRVPTAGAMTLWLIIAGWLAAGQWKLIANHQNSISIPTPQTPTIDEMAAEKLARFTTQNGMVLTDAQGIAFLAHRDVPPDLVDTSYKRISAGYLTAAQVIKESQCYQVQAALLWSGRLNQIPEVSAWVKGHFSRHQSFGDGRILWFSVR